MLQCSQRAVDAHGQFPSVTCFACLSGLLHYSSSPADARLHRALDDIVAGSLFP
jgi:hypothetical protein